MSQDNRISITIPQPVADEVLVNIKRAAEALKPFLKALTDDERKTLAKMGDKSIAFVTKTHAYCGSNAEFAPNFLDIPELGKDLDAAISLTPMLKALKVLLSDVDDTIMLCGNEAYTGARFYYNSVVFAAKNGNTSAKPIAEDLAKRYPGVSHKKGVIGL